MAYQATPIQERFWRNVKKGRRCWVWTGALCGSGYGKLFVKKTRKKITCEMAHRLSYAFAFGPIPEGMCVCHRCDNKLCVRPSHLFIGTHSDNIRDAMSKGRANLEGLKIGWKRRGGDHPCSKYSEDQSDEVRRLHASGMMQLDIGKKLGIGKGSVWYIIHKRKRAGT